MKNWQKQGTKLLCAGGIVLTGMLLPEIGGLPRAGVQAAGILAASLLLWISDALPMFLSILIMIGISMTAGITSPEATMARLDLGTGLFVLASSGITAAVALSGLPKRITHWLFKHSRGKTSRFVFGVGLLVAVCSSMMSSLATCALFAGLVDGILGKDKSSLRRCLMLVIPACAGIGGFMTPAGTPANLLLMQLLSDAGTPITFLQWTAIGVPLGLVTALLFVGSALLIIRPEMVSFGECHPTPTSAASSRDGRTITILILMLLGWILSGWLPWLKLWHVACAGAVIMVLPRFGLITARDFLRHINWDLTLTMVSVSALMGAIADSGLIAWVSNRLIHPMAELPAWAMLSALSLAICFIRAFIPTTTGAVTLLAPLLIGLAEASGLSSSVLLMLLAFWTACAMLLVYTEPIFLLTRGQQDYSALDLMKVGIAPSFLMGTLGSTLLQWMTLKILGG